MNIFSFFRRKIKAAPQENDNSFDDSYSAAEQRFRLTELALFTAIDFIAKSIAKCEFVTVIDNKEYKGLEYYLWNYAPNKHQTKVEFLTQAISKLIFDNELLIISTADNQLLIADSYCKTEYAVFDDIFTSVTCRNFTYQRTFSESEVIYLKYNSFALRGLLAEMCTTYEQLMMSAQERYNKAVGHKGIVTFENFNFGDKDFNETFSEILGKQFKKYYESKNAVLPVFKGMKYSEPATEAGKTTNSEITDIQKLRAEAYATVGNALHIPPAILSGEASMLSDAMDCAIANAVDPIAQMFEQEITKKKFGNSEFLKGNYMLIDTTTVRRYKQCK